MRPRARAISAPAPNPDDVYDLMLDAVDLDDDANAHWSTHLLDDYASLAPSDDGSTVPPPDVPRVRSIRNPTASMIVAMQGPAMQSDLHSSAEERVRVLTALRENWVKRGNAPLSPSWNTVTSASSPPGTTTPSDAESLRSSVKKRPATENNHTPPLEYYTKPLPRVPVSSTLPHSLLSLEDPIAVTNNDSTNPRSVDDEKEPRASFEQSKLEPIPRTSFDSSPLPRSSLDAAQRGILDRYNAGGHSNLERRISSIPPPSPRSHPISLMPSPLHDDDASTKSPLDTPSILRPPLHFRSPLPADEPKSPSSRFLPPVDDEKLATPAPQSPKSSHAITPPQDTGVKIPQRNTSRNYIKLFKTSPARAPESRLSIDSNDSLDLSNSSPKTRSSKWSQFVDSAISGNFRFPRPMFLGGPPTVASGDDNSETISVVTSLTANSATNSSYLYSEDDDEDLRVGVYPSISDPTRSSTIPRGYLAGSSSSSPQMPPSPLRTTYGSVPFSRSSSVSHVSSSVDNRPRASGQTISVLPRTLNITTHSTTSSVVVPPLSSSSSSSSPKLRHGFFPSTSMFSPSTSLSPVTPPTSPPKWSLTSNTSGDQPQLLQLSTSPPARQNRSTPIANNTLPLREQKPTNLMKTEHRSNTDITTSHPSVKSTNSNRMTTTRVVGKKVRRAASSPQILGESINGHMFPGQQRTQQQQQHSREPQQQSHAPVSSSAASEVLAGRGDKSQVAMAVNNARGGAREPQALSLSIGTAETRSGGGQQQQQSGGSKGRITGRVVGKKVRRVRSSPQILGESVNAQYASQFQSLQERSAAEERKSFSRVSSADSLAHQLTRSASMGPHNSSILVEIETLLADAKTRVNARLVVPRNASFSELESRLEERVRDMCGIDGFSGSVRGIWRKDGGGAGNAFVILGDELDWKHCLSTMTDGHVFLLVDAAWTRNNR